MGFKTLISKNVESAFNILGASDADGLQQSITYTRILSAGTYDPILGSSVAETETHVFDSIVYQARDREIDGIKIKVGDKRLIFPTSRLTFTPSHDDSVMVDGEKMELVNIYPDPSGSVYTIFIRGV